jgi:hypothetical protein
MASELAEKISRVPHLYETGNKSTACLLKDAGFPEMKNALSVEDIETIFKQEPHLAELWLKRGSDQRIAGGWGIEGKNGEYRVQSFADGHCLHVPDRCRACAEFVVRYVSFIGEVLARTR